MATSEQWIKWEPINGLSCKYQIDSVSDTIDGFFIVLSSTTNEKKIKITFEGYLLSYRKTDESFRQSTVTFLEEHYKTKFYAEWTFFKVINSTYLQWLSEESYGFSDSVPPIHFSFIDDDSILDVVATYEPKVEFIEEK